VAEMPAAKTKAHETLAQARRALSGLEFFRKIQRGELPLLPIHALFGIRPVEVEEGYAVFAALPAEPFYNGMGVVHGGFAATLLDTGLGCAVNTRLPAGHAFTTLELKVTMVKALRRETGEVRCVARAIHVGRQVGTSEARIVDGAGTIYAHGTATCIRLKPKQEHDQKQEPT
jgi:uncharacterized protein (TIGR00369 family)